MIWCFVASSKNLEFDSDGKWFPETVTVARELKLKTTQTDVSLEIYFIEADWKRQKIFSEESEVDLVLNLFFSQNVRRKTDTAEQFNNLVADQVDKIGFIAAMSLGNKSNRNW